MKNHQGHDIRHIEIEPEDVEWFGLTRFIEKEMEELDWNWFPVLELDLSIQPNGHAGFAMEQQFHFQTMHFKLGHQGINRVPGAENWDMESQSIITAIGFTYATIMFSLVCVIPLSHLLLLFETLHVMTGWWNYVSVRIH